MSRSASAEVSWESPRWDGITRAYQKKDVERLRTTCAVEHSVARAASDKLWRLLHREEFVSAQSAVNAKQAVELAKAGLKAIHQSGRHFAADANLSGQLNPDPNLFAGNTASKIVRSINNALRAQQITENDGPDSTDWMLPILAEAEFGTVLNAFELTKSLIEAGAAALQFNDRLSPAESRGHFGGKVLVPTGETIHKLIAARLAADILDVPTILIACTETGSDRLIASNVDADDATLLTRDRTIEGFFAMRGGIDAAIARGLAYAPYADLLWFQTSEPNLAEARKFAKAIHAQFPGKLLACNCSRSLHSNPWEGGWEIAEFQRELASLGYRLQLVAEASIHALKVSSFEAARGYAYSEMPTYS
jgi:isocitrate lyase